MWILGELRVQDLSNRDYNRLQFEQDCDIIVALEGLTA